MKFEGHEIPEEKCIIVERVEMCEPEGEEEKIAVEHAEMCVPEETKRWLQDDPIDLQHPDQVIGVDALRPGQVVVRAHRRPDGQTEIEELSMTILADPPFVVSSADDNVLRLYGQPIDPDANLGPVQELGSLADLGVFPYVESGWNPVNGLLEVKPDGSRP